MQNMLNNSFVRRRYVDGLFNEGFSRHSPIKSPAMINNIHFLIRQDFLRTVFIISYWN